MNAEEYAEWRDDARTVLFFQFLSDYRQGLMERWAAGDYHDLQKNAQQIGRAMMLHDLGNMADDAIADFYRQRKGSDSEQVGATAG